jgi:flagellar assembly factor FliW
MPHLQTRDFGEIEYRDDAVIEFPAGLPGFEQEKRFLPIEHPASRPIIFLQSLSRAGLCFITLPVRALAPDFVLSLAPEDLDLLSFQADARPEIGRDALCLAIVSVAEGKPPTANLLAPVVVNMAARRGVQAIQAECGYSHQHPLLPASGAQSCS